MRKYRKIRFLALFLCLSLILPSLGGMGIKAKADDDISMWSYTLDETKSKVLLKEYIGTEEDVYVKDKYFIDGDYYDTILDNSKGVFFYKKFIKSVVFGSDVEVKEGDASEMFSGCSNLETVTNLPKNIIKMDYTFALCESLVYAPKLPSKAEILSYTFEDCSSLLEAPEIPNSVWDMSRTFSGCTSLISAPNIPLGVTDMTATFSNCSNLRNAPVIPRSVSSATMLFYSMDNLVGDVYIKSELIDSYRDMFTAVNKYVTVHVPKGTLELWESRREDMKAKSNVDIVEDDGNQDSVVERLIKSQSGNQRVVTGLDMNLYVVAEPDSEDKTLEYQWYKDEVELEGETSSSYTKTVEENDSGIYYCIVTQSDGKTEKSNDIQITIVDNPIQGDLDDLQDIIDEIEDMLDGLPGDTPQEKIDNLLDDLEKAQEDLEKAREERDEAQQELADLREYIESLKDIVFGSGSGKSDSDLKSRLEQVFSALPDLQKDAELLEQVKDRLGLDQSATGQDVLVKIEELKDRGTLLDEIGDIPGVDKDDIINQITIIINNNDIYNQIIILIGSSEDKVLDDINQMITDLTELESFVNELRGILDLDSNASYDDIISAIRELLNENTSLKEQLIEALNRITELEDLLDSETGSNTDLLERISQLENDIEDLNEQLQNSEADKDDLNNQLIELQDEYENLLDQLNEANVRIHDLDRQISNLESEIARLEQLIQDALDSLTDYEGSDLLEKIENIKNKKNKLRDDLDNANSINADLNEQIDRANNRLEEMQDEIDRLLGELQDKDVEIQRLKDLLKEKDRIISDLKNSNKDLKSKNKELQDQINDLLEGNPILEDLQRQLEEKNKELDRLKDQIRDKNREIEDLKKEIEDLKKNQGGIKDLEDRIKELEEELQDARKEIDALRNSYNGNNDGVPTPTTPIVEIKPKEEITEEVIDKVLDGNISANDDWEVSDSLNSNTKWGGKLNLSGGNRIGVFTFFNNETGIYNPIESITKSSLLKAQEPKKEFVKYTFYARRKNDPSKIYTCDLNVEKSDYITPVTKITTNNKNIKQSFDTLNTYKVEVNKNVKFTVNADFGNAKKEGIYYQVVDSNQDFDPDANWTKINGNSFTVKKPTKSVRVYVKSVDKAGNFTVDKMDGFKPTTKNINRGTTKPASTTVPVFTMNKTIELGNTYKLRVANTNGIKKKFTSSNKSVASVDKNGNIKAKKKGNSVVTGTITKGNYSYKFKVNVNVVKGEYNKTLSLKEIKTVKGTKNPVFVNYKMVKKNKNTKINITNIPKGYTVSYKSDNTKIATVSKNGTITGIKKGYTTITATVKKGKKSYVYQMIVRVDNGTSDPTMWEYLIK